MGDFASRLTILTKKEIEDIYNLPHFTNGDRQFFFSMNTKEQEVLDSLRSFGSQVLFILQLGYFKAKRIFFSITEDQGRHDIEYIVTRYFETDAIPTGFINEWTRWSHQKIILELCEYSVCDEVWKQNLKSRAAWYSMISSKPICVFKELLSYLEKSRVVLPRYSTMVDIISKALTAERQRLTNWAKEQIPIEIETELKDLLFKKENFYILTDIKKQPKDFTKKEMGKEIKKKNTLGKLFLFAAEFLKKLNISNDNINYYSSLVDFYSINRMGQIGPEIMRIYLLCYIHNRYQQINDNLLETFIHHVRKYEEIARCGSHKRIMEEKQEGNNNLGKVGLVLGMFFDEEIPDTQDFGAIRERAFGYIQKDKFPKIIQYISKIRIDYKEYEWKEIDTQAQAFKTNLRPVFSALELQCIDLKDPLIEAVEFLKQAIKNGRPLASINSKNFPLRFANRRLKRYIEKSVRVKVKGGRRKLTQIQTNRYEFAVFSTLRQYLDSGDVFASNSFNFRSFEEDLVDEEYWQENMVRLVKELNQLLLSKSIEETLAELKVELEALIVAVNKRIAEGKNKGIKITGSGERIRWTLPYKKLDDSTNHPLYEHLPQVEITDLMKFVDGKCLFMKAFTHILNRYSKKESSYDAIMGALIARATNKSLTKMAESSDLNFQELRSANDDFLRPETLREANDAITNAAYKLPIFNHFNIEEGLIHSSSDGQKFETRVHTFNAQFSPKYFGMKKGIVSYTLQANHFPVNARIICPHDHESQFVFDIVHNNTSNIRPDRLSVDTHGTNSVNFLILEAHGYEFAPRYKDLRSKTENIYAFGNPKDYEGLLIKPSRRVKEQLIIKEWPTILKILVSLGLKTTSQSVIVRKLSSYARKNRTKRAMWELDSIFRSRYLLKYIDNLLLRQSVQRALNRGEAYHQLRRAVSFEHGGKLSSKTPQEQEVVNDCARLVSNAIIFYNAYLLSILVDHLQETARNDLLALVARVSPVAWRHVNLSGKFQFISNDKLIDMENIVMIMTSTLEKKL